MPETTVRLPLWKNILDDLIADPDFTYGSVIKWERLETAFKSSRTRMAFRQEQIKLTQALEERGFFLTERGMHDEGLRVLLREEMANHAHQKALGRAKKTKRVAIGLGNVDTTGMKDTDVKRLDGEQRRMGYSAALQVHALTRRSLPASPEMAVKSLRQIR